MSYIFLGILIYFFALTIWYTFLLAASFPEVINRFKKAEHGNIIQLINEEHLIPITIITPAFNEEKCIRTMIYSVLKSDYKNVQLIVVNDGSTDNMMEILQKEFDLYETPYVVNETLITSKIRTYYKSNLYENLLIIDKEHFHFNCPADAINAGINACNTPIMLTLDADTFLEPGSISSLLYTFFSIKHCIGVCGSVYVLNGNKVEDGTLIEVNLAKEFIPAVQSVEYLRSFLYGRTGWNALGGALCFPGAFAMYETQLVREFGGYDSKNFSYDVEITMRLHHWMRKKKHPHYLVHTSNAFSWTTVPNTLKSFWVQRDRWQRGMLRSSMSHIEMLFNPKYGMVGIISFPAYILFEIFGPVIEFISYVLFILGLLFGSVSWSLFFWFILLAWGYITFLTICMLFLDMVTFNRYKRVSNTFRIIWLVFADMLWFRQVRSACSFLGTLRYLFNRLMRRPL